MCHGMLTKVRVEFLGIDFPFHCELQGLSSSPSACVWQVLLLLFKHLDVFFLVFEIGM